jgi:signal transduction histidine kinase
MKRYPMKCLFAHKKKSEYKLLLKNTQEIIIFFDSKCKILECNSKAVNELGYGDDIYKIPINNIFKNVFIYEENKFMVADKYLKKPEETIAYRKNQTCFPVDLRITTNRRKKSCLGLCTAINITDKKNIIRETNHLKNEINNYNQMSNELVANITHELRTPVNGIMGFTNILADTKLKPNQMEAVNIIKRCCTNMNTLINDMLDYAKLSNNKLIIEEREFDFRDFVSQIVGFNSAALNEKDLKLILDIADNIPETVIGDELRLAQVLNNLFSNAIKFTPSGQVGLKIMKISQSGESIELFFMVIDTGIGISREEKDKLFKSFSQVDSSITRRFGGTGLGLSISKMLVEAMHGSIDVDSEKNMGSTFSFSVRLGLPKTKAVEISETPECCEGMELEESGSNENVADMSDLDYIDMVLKEAGTSGKELTSGMDAMREALVLMKDNMEKLTICIEMENWEKAEELACNMKKLLPKDHAANIKNVFRLILAVRKENHDISLSILNELKEHMCEEK